MGGIFHSACNRGGDDLKLKDKKKPTPQNQDMSLMPVFPK